MTTIIMRTSEGDIKINLFDDETPETVANFLGLATGESLGMEFVHHRDRKSVV